MTLTNLAPRYNPPVSTRDALHAMIDDLPEELLWLAEMHLSQIQGGGGDSNLDSMGPIRAEDVEGGPEGGWRAVWAQHGITDADLDAIFE